MIKKVNSLDYNVKVVVQNLYNQTYGEVLMCMDEAVSAWANKWPNSSSIWLFTNIMDLSAD